MAQKVDYVKLRKIYFNHQAGREPSHSTEQTEPEGYLNDSENVKIHELMTMTADSEESLSNLNFREDLENDYLQEFGEYKSKLSQHANDMINKLYEKYGAQIYSKINQLMKDKDYIEWNQLEQELLSGNFELMIEDKENLSFDTIDNLPRHKELDSLLEIDYQDQDLNYLDAIVTQDHGRLNHLQSDKSSIRSIFSEILENEQQGHSNYQDDVFEKNIELIFNPDIDLDDSQWSMTNENYTLDGQFANESVMTSDPSQHLDEIINQELELLQTHYNISSERSFPEVTPQSIEENMHSSITNIPDSNAEKVTIKKVLAKKRTNSNFNTVLIVLCLLTSVLTVAVIMLLMMVLN